MLYVRAPAFYRTEGVAGAFAFHGAWHLRAPNVASSGEEVLWLVNRAGRFNAGAGQPPGAAPPRDANEVPVAAVIAGVPRAGFLPAAAPAAATGDGARDNLELQGRAGARSLRMSDWNMDSPVKILQTNIFFRLSARRIVTQLRAGSSQSCAAMLCNFL